VDTSERTVGWSQRRETPPREPTPSTALDAWSQYPWSDGVQVDELSALDTVAVQTRNTRYEITIVDGRNGEVLVTGGRFFPVPTRVRINGCTLGGSCLKWRGVYPGFLMELQIGNEIIVTTRVRSVERLPSATSTTTH
jgi:hypothetical protein